MIDVHHRPAASVFGVGSCWLVLALPPSFRKEVKTRVEGQYMGEEARPSESEGGGRWMGGPNSPHPPHSPHIFSYRRAVPGTGLVRRGWACTTTVAKYKQ